MNMLHLKYAVEVQKTSSINKAAENLFMGQPNLSRAIKDLEESLGITIFRRTSKGMSATPQGEEFLAYAKKLLSDIDEVEAKYRNGEGKRQRFSVSVPRASYIAAAFTEFTKQLDQTKPVEIYYKETNAVRAISNILQNDYQLGIIRYQAIYDKQFKMMLVEKGLDSQLISEFNHRIILSHDHPLASNEIITHEDLKDSVEIAHADPYVPFIPTHEVQKEEYMEDVDKRIFVFERASQLELLESVPNAFMWVAPMPPDLLDKYHLVQRNCADDDRIYKDVLIYREGYSFTNLDDLFISEVCHAKRKYF